MRKAFTLIELMIAVIILGVGLIGVFLTMKNSYKFLQEIKQKTIAINFARGGVEGVFTIRNTNWLRWSGKKDACWLKTNPLVDESNDGCENDEWFESGSTYILDLTGSQMYFYLKKTGIAFDPSGPIKPDDWQYLICKDPTNSLIKACPNYTSKPNNYFDPTLFFRQIRGGYLLDKNSNSLISCEKGTDANCGDGRFLEKNFCVDVFYFDGAKKSISFCTVMTNFKK